MNYGSYCGSIRNIARKFQSIQSINQRISNSDGLPTTQSVQQVITYVGSGQVAQIHYGFTIDEQGNFHEHA